jgi:pimeloyl-ACP methyl ester carboxylesterase
MMRETPAKGAAAALRGRAERPDYCAVLGRFGHLALVVVGDQDAFTTRQDADRMHGLLQRSRLLWMPGVGHMPNLEQPEAFNAALAEFLGQFAGLEKAQDASLADWDRMIDTNCRGLT